MHTRGSLLDDGQRLPSIQPWTRNWDMGSAKSWPEFLGERTLAPSGILLTHE